MGNGSSDVSTIEGCDKWMHLVPLIWLEGALGLHMIIQRSGRLIVDGIQDSLLNGRGHLLVHGRHLASVNYILDVFWYHGNLIHTGGSGSASKRPHRASDPFSNPHVQRATGKTRSQESSSSYSSGSWFSGSDPYSGYWGGPRRKSSASARAEEEHAREAEVNSQSGLWSAFPTIGVTLLFLMLAHGWGAKA